MKTPFITQTAFLLVLLGLASCRSAKTSAPSPRQEKPVIIVSNPGPSNLPPGQAKKIYGDQSAKSHAPGQQKKKVSNRVYFPLIIIRTPDIVISRYSDGRYYYKNAQGYYYWQGTDNRFYLGEEHLAKIKYDEKEYEDWNLKRKKNNGKDDTAKEDKGHEEKANQGNGKGNDKNNGNKKN
jgi:hypothetical protein